MMMERERVYAPKYGLPVDLPPVALIVGRDRRRHQP